MFWSEYTDLDHNNGPYDDDEFIWIRKDIRDVNSHLCHHKDSIVRKKFLGFLAFKVTSKFLGVGADESSWGHVQKIKPCKRYSISSDV